MFNDLLFKIAGTAFILVCIASSSSAETIVLKTGERITGTVIEKNERYVKVDYKGAVIIYRVREIDSIDGKSIVVNEAPMLDKPLESLLESHGAPIGASSPDIITPEEYLGRGFAFYNKGNFDQAIADLTRAINGKSDYAGAYLYRGLAYMGKNDPDHAIADYDKAIEINPKNEEACYVRGLAYSAKKDLDKALADYNAAIEINPKYVQAYLNRAFIKIIKGDGDGVISDVGKILEINQKIPAAYFLRGLVYVNENNMEQAIADYTKAIELKGDYIEAYINRALAYAYRRKVELAKMGPTSPAAYINIGDQDINKEDVDRAIADCNEAIKLNPKYVEAYGVRARIHLLAQDYDKAWKDVRDAEDLGAAVKPEFLEELKRASGRNE